MKNAFDGTPIEIWGDGGVERDFLHVTDVAHAFLLAEAAQEPPPVVNIGSGQGVSLQEALELVETATSRSIDKVYREGRPIDVRRNVLDCSLARESFGWSPRVGLMQGLEQTAAWWKEITQAR
jgi:UDP-glucose 4-epimerase